MHAKAAQVARPSNGAPGDGAVAEEHVVAPAANELRGGDLLSAVLDEVVLQPLVKHNVAPNMALLRDLGATGEDLEEEVVDEEAKGASALPASNGGLQERRISSPTTCRTSKMNRRMVFVNMSKKSPGPQLSPIRQQKRGMTCIAPSEACTSKTEHRRRCVMK